MKKIALIMGRGIEGCGVTRFTNEQFKWFTDHEGFEPIIIASADKGWTRKKSQDTKNIWEIKFSDNSSVTEMIGDINENFDVVIINSLPAKSFPKEAIEGFKRFLTEITPPVVLVQHDHSKLSIIRNECIDEAVKRANMIFVHSTNNDFSELVEETLGLGGLGAFMDDNPETPLIGFQPGMHMGEYQGFGETNPDTHKWIGRTTSWKGYQEMFKFSEAFLSPNDQIVTFEGIEKSPAYLAFKELGDFTECIGEDADDFTEEKGLLPGDPYVFGPFVRQEMLRRMNATRFGYQLSKLKPKFIDRSIEYTHLEVVRTNAIPVFAKQYGKLCTHRATGKKLIEHGDESGTIWLDEKNMGECWEKMKELQSDRKLRKKWKEQAFDFYKEHQDAEYTFVEMWENIETIL